MSFHSLGLAPELLRAVADEGYARPTPIQQEAIPLALAGRDLIGSAQTGTGKTAAFMLPILQRLAGGDRGHALRALILVPTRELAEQVLQSARTYGRHVRVTAAAVYGGVGMEPQTRALKHGADIVVATPGRLLDHMERGHVDFSRLEVLVLDEADRMLDMGFAPDVRRILAALPDKRQTMLFSATISPEVVAENSIVWRLTGSAARMRRTSGANPMSSIRSASSSTSTSSREKSTCPRSMWSRRRPGVATTMSAPCFSARVCGSIPTPPYTAAAVTRTCRPYVRALCNTCSASSRVGTRISARSACPLSPPASRWRIGSMNAAVLPVPVWAEPIRSRPARASGIASCWIGVGRA